MKRLVAVAALLAALLVADTAQASSPAVTLQASAAQTTTGNGTVVMDVSSCQRVTVFYIVTASSGTAGNVTFGIQGSPDGGTTWGELGALTGVMQGTNGIAFGNRVFSSSAIAATGTYSGHYEPGTPIIRAYWGITGGASPSMTFSVVASCR